MALLVRTGGSRHTGPAAPPHCDIQAIVCRSDYDPSDIGNYGCSFFDDLEMLRIILHMPRKNKQIAGGVLKKEFGPIVVEGVCP